MFRDYSRAAVVVAVCVCGAAQADDGFWKYWGDGKAELDGYALVQPRYGELRDGTAVLIFVTEDFSDSLRVKADAGKHAASDVYPVLKLNFVRDFQTGIYDYNVLTSSFWKTESGFAPAKVSFSSQEWCGHVYQQLLPRAGKLTGELHSYFDGEADAPLELPMIEGGLLEEQVPILIRSLRTEWLSPGESRTLPFLPSALRARLDHKRQAWGKAKVTRSVAKAGREQFVVEEKNGPTVTWTVESAAPRRILEWRSTTGESARLLGSTRLPYWKLHDNGGESYLKELGLPVPVAKKRAK